MEVITVAGHSGILKRPAAVDYVSVLCAGRGQRKTELTALNFEADEVQSCIITAQFLNLLGFNDAFLMPCSYCL